MHRVNESGRILWCWLAVALLCNLPQTANADIEPLWFSLGEPAAGEILDSSCCVLPAKFQAAEPKQGKHDAASGGRPGGPPSGSHGVRKVRFESEHRGVPVRSYYLNAKGLNLGYQALVLRPDGSTIVPDVQKKKDVLAVTFPTPMGDGLSQGANNVYVVDQAVVDNELVVRTAKWLTIHHSCGWGHDHKFSEQRNTSLSVDSIPLEIVVNDIWDPNFHSNVMSGDSLDIRILNNGKPAAGAAVKLISEKGWVKEAKANENGSTVIQMVRDYYPESWLSFDRSTKGRLKVVAEYTVEQPGHYLGMPYERVRMVSTFPWRYYPARDDYASYGYGLLLGTLGFGVGGVGIYAFRERRKNPHKETYLDE